VRGLVLGGLATAATLLTLTALNLRGVIIRTTAPEGSFDPTMSPDPPDYADPSNWSALPERADAGDAVSIGVASVDQQAAPVDVFYVHPTSYLGSGWNGPTTDAKLNQDTDWLSTNIQATAFNGCCAVYAPRYRQASGQSFYAPSADGDRALDLAYDDLRRAFAEFNRRRGPGRPFVLAGHSQGAMLAERLLIEEVSGGPLAKRLVVAVLPGGRMTVAGLAEAAPDLPVCAAPSQTGCVVAWNARGPGFVENDLSVHRFDTRPLVCVNPITWRADLERADAEQNPGAVFLEHPDPRPVPGLASAQCRADGVLLVDELGEVPRDTMSRILDRVLGPENYHAFELQLYFMSLRENTNRRVEGWLGAQAGAE
jgi:pimeloyl-ACP methyl ester carboxylesterase